MMIGIHSLDAVFFDLDGTLIDLGAAEQASIMQVMRERAVVPTAGRIDRYRTVNRAHWDAYERGEMSRGQLLSKRFEVFFEDIGHPLPNGSGEGARIDRHYQILLADNTVLLEGATELLSSLHGRIPLLLVTNGVHDTAVRKLRVSGLDAYFPHIASSESVGGQKPDFAFFTASMRLCGVSNPGRVLMVGDLWGADIAGAANAGLLTCWMNPEQIPVPEDARHAPDLEIRRLSELKALLEPTL